MTMLATVHPARVLDAACRTDFVTFTGMCVHLLTPGKSFLPNWHIEKIAYHLEQVRLGKIRRLIINMPPRSLKSLMSSVAWPAYILGHDPTKQLVAISYSSDLAIYHSNGFRTIMNAPWYQRIFSGTQISRLKNTELEVATTWNGYRLATSVDGTLSGRGGDIFIIDDPLKPIDALSDSKRESVNKWFINTLQSRPDDKLKGAIVIVMQRLHPDDLTGMLLRTSNDWTLLNLPAIAEQEEKIQIGANKYHIRRVGDVLHPEREPKFLLDSIRSQVGSDIFAAQWQQAPIPPDGLMINRDWVRRYDQLPARASSSYVIQSWDTASREGGQNDWSVCTTWLLHENKYYLIDVLRGRFDYPTLKAQAISLASLHKPAKILIEDAGVGTALVRELQNAGLSAIAVKPEHDKLTRMSIQSAKFQGGRVYWPNEAPWLPDLEAEVFAFPNGRHDDQVDSISQALAHEMSEYLWNERSLAGLTRSADASIPTLESNPR
jgi:predicted phage terminase large subunit-like protein